MKTAAVFIDTREHATSTGDTHNLQRQLHAVLPAGHAAIACTPLQQPSVAFTLRTRSFVLRDTLVWAQHDTTAHIILARAPFTGALLDHIATEGTGALNINKVRVPMHSADREHGAKNNAYQRVGSTPANNHTYDDALSNPRDHDDSLGRFPTNLILQHGPTCNTSQCMPTCPTTVIDRQSGDRPGGNVPTRAPGPRKATDFRGYHTAPDAGRKFDDSGGASRFFPTIPYGEEHMRNWLRDLLEPTPKRPTADNTSRVD